MTEYSPLQGMRFQSQLSKEMKRAYKEGDNVVALSFAEVIKVNYKYNTVDVITTKDKNTTTKNPNDNGKFSARLPVAFGGRTPEGNVYGTNTLVTVGSKVLIGFVDGNKDNPIVINIYGAVDNQSMLTRTTMTSGDESDAGVQRELWQLFNLYPSMTYTNVDGRGNREVTFSGKSFLYVTDTDQNNEYVQDEAFDYMDLPSSRYANGELIEPESPKAPTVLYVHQGIYEKHRFTVFIKSDGTFRMGSRNLNGHGVTYQQMNTDGSFSIVKKNDTTNPEEESYDQSSMEILKNGNVLLQNPKHKFEITDDGILVDGKKLSEIGGGGSGTNPEYEEAIRQINETIETMSVTMKSIEGGLETKVEKNTYEIDLDEIKGAQDALLAEIKAIIATLKVALEDLRTFIGSGFPDGKVTDTRKIELNKKMQSIDASKTVLDGKYTEVMADPFLSDTLKNTLKISKDRVDGYHQALHNVIDASITDGTITAQEKTDINTAITNYVTSLNNIEPVFTSSIEASITERIKEAVENPVNYTNKEMKKQSAVFTQLFNAISMKVSTEELTSQVQDLEIKMATKEEQKELADELERVDNKVNGALSNLPYRVEVSSTNGTVFVNDFIDSVVSARFYKGTDDITSTVGIGDIIWLRVSDDQAGDTAWNNNHKGIGNSFRLSVNDVRDRATFFCSYKTPPVATGSLTVANLKDISVSKTEPVNPRQGTMWYNMTDGKLYVYMDGKWQFSADGLDFNIRNLLTNSRDCTGGGWAFQSASRTNSQYQGTYIIETAANWGSADYAVTDLFTRGVVANNEDVTFCVLARLTGATGVTRNLSFFCEQSPASGTVVGTVTTDWKPFYITFKMLTAMNTAGSKLRFEVGDLTAANLKLQVCSHILVKGTSQVNWVPAPEDTQRDIDNINKDVGDIRTNVDSLGDDKRLTRFERSLIRSYLADITGTYYNPTDVPIALTEIDKPTYGKGKLFSIRQQARNIGLDTTKSPYYKKLGDAYTALIAYLNGFTPKPWDVTSSAIIDLPDRTLWNQKWNDYYNFYALFEIEVQDRQKEFTEQETQKMSKDTIAAISTAGNYETVPFENPLTVTPPIATLGLPEFQGNHQDSWEWNGRNYILHSDVAYSWTGKMNDNGFSTKQMSPLSVAAFDKQRVTFLLSYKLTDVVYGTVNPWVGMQLTVEYTDGVKEYPTLMGGKADGSPTTSDFVRRATTYQFNAAKTLKSLSVMLGGRDLTGKVEIKDYKIEVGNKTVDQAVWTLAPEDAWGAAGNRIRPVTNPMFSSGTNLTILGKFYGDGTVNDKFSWDTSGTPVKTRYWVDTTLDTLPKWAYSSKGVNTNSVNKLLKSSGNNEYPILFDDTVGNRVGRATLGFFEDYVILTSTDASDSFYQLGDYNMSLHGFSVGETVTLSAEVNGDLAGAYMSTWISDGTNWIEARGDVGIAGTWQKLKHTFKIPSNAKGLFFRIYFPRGTAATNTKLRIKKVQVERGNFATMWTPASLQTFKRVRADGATYAAIIHASEVIVKHDGKLLVRDGNTQESDTMGANATNGTLYVAIADTDSGWGDAYTPTEEEIKAYFAGWRMCNGQFGGQYVSGGKVWYPHGDKNLDRAATGRSTAPTDNSPSFVDKTARPYQFLYRLVDPIQDEVSFDGILELLPKANVVTTYYPAWTPPILAGTIKYGINLATVNQDTRYIIPTMMKRVASAEQKITDEAITSTVVNSREYTLGMKSKADSSDLGNYATKDELDKVNKGVDDRIKGEIDKIDFKPFVEKSELEQTARDWNAKFSAANGMNIVKNSIGFSGTDFWEMFQVNTTVETISNSALDSLGLGSGFYFRKDGKNKGITQKVKVIPNQPYTLGFYLNKMTKGAKGDQTYRFWIQVQNSAGTVTHQIDDNSDMTTNGLEGAYLTFTPLEDTVTIRFVAYANVEAIVSGIMLNIGDIPLQWTLSTGELYNTNVRMNLNGLRVAQNDANGVEVGYTQITPSEFAGFYKNGNGGYEKVFYLNGDETVTKKLKATQEITLGNIKIIDVTSTDITGWAFVPTVK
ncbi:minor tail protein [Bacillus phage vB_BcgM]|nr:minor tail protein [Bacillus phage vB_BcgM]